MCYFPPPRYLPATLSAKDGRIKKTQVIIILIMNWLTRSLSFWPPNMTKDRPANPKATDA